MDWRQAFPDDSAGSWERRLREALGERAADVWPFRTAWRSDSRLPLARDLEYHLAEMHGVDVVDVRGLDAWSPPKHLRLSEIAAVAEMVVVTQRLLVGAGINELTLFRGVQAAEWEADEAVQLVGRGLSSWTPDRAVAVGYAAKVRRGTVFRTVVAPRRVAMLFDPSSDGEAVVIGDVEAVVTDII
jgi:hypothetical protein